MSTSNELLLLDFGGVVLKTNFELRHLAEPGLGPLPWQGPFDPDNDPEWCSFQRGEITERQFWADRAALYGLDTKGLMRHFYEPSGNHLVRPEMVTLIERHKADGGIVGMLTNDLRDFHGAQWMEAISVIAEFDFIVDGSVTKVLKPHPQAFQFALQEFGDPDPDSVVFVDDQPVNLAGGAAVGLTCVQFLPTDVGGSIERIEVALAATNGR